MAHFCNLIDDMGTRRLNSCRLILALVLFSIVGCGGLDPNDAIAEANDTNMKKLANLYFTFQMKHNWKGPRDEKEFRAFITGFNAAKLERIGIDPAEVDGLFLNDRDGKPFKIRYGVPGSAMGSSEAVIFEEEGAGGERMIGFLNMEQRAVDASEYERLWSNKPKKNSGASQRSENRQ